MMDPAALERLSQAQRLYQRHGFTHVEVPWIVSPQADRHTRPSFVEPVAAVGASCTLLQGNLPGSGEQGFIQRVMEGSLAEGRWQTCTPCFRDERHLDALHLPWFTKVELAVVGHHWTSSGLAALALLFFRSHLPRATIINTGQDTYDIVHDGLELGSYGYRTVGSQRLVYGTGCAEPRLGTVIARRRQ